jgi:hypothetical protein
MKDRSILRKYKTLRRRSLRWTKREDEGNPVWLLLRQAVVTSPTIYSHSSDEI